MATTSAAVIGAGAAGVVAAKELLASGLSVTVLEKQSPDVGLGGMWAFRSDVNASGSACYASLHTNTSREMMGFSDFPMDCSLPLFPHHSQVLAYLRDYSDHFGVSGCVQYSCTVTRVRRACDRTGGRPRWAVTWKKGQAESTQEFDFVVICSGRYLDPYTPPTFKNSGARTVVHSCQYRSATLNGFSPEQRVVVVGSSVSAVEIATECSLFSNKPVKLLLRTPRYFMPKQTPQGLAVDQALLTRWGRLLGRWLPAWLQKRKFLSWIASQSGCDMTAWGLPQPSLERPFERRLTTCNTLLQRSAEGAVQALVGDASSPELDDADVVILATGFRLSIPYLEEADFKCLAGASRSAGSVVHPTLFKYAFCPGLDGMAFIGFQEQIGAYNPANEMVARWVAAVAEGAISLPSNEVMNKWIATKQQARLSRPDHHNMVTCLEVEETVAEELGTLPPSWWQEPALAWSLWMRPAFPYIYRMRGKGAWSGARANYLRALSGCK